MPIITTLVTRAVLGRCDGQSPSASRAIITWPDDLGRRQIAHQLLRAGVAEAAIQRAADLRGDAQRAAVRFRE